MSAELTRRSVLKRTTTGAIALAAVGTATAGTAAAKRGQGGSGYVTDETWDAHADDEFQVVEELGTTEFACRGAEKTWQCYEVEFRSGETALLHVNPERRLDTVEEGYERYHAFTPNATDCRECARVKVSFKPVTPRNDR